MNNELRLKAIDYIDLKKDQMRQRSHKKYMSYSDEMYINGMFDMLQFLMEESKKEDQD